MNSWKSSSLPLCGVAVMSSRLRVLGAEQLAELVALGLLHLAAEVRAPTSGGPRRPPRGPTAGRRPWPGALRCATADGPGRSTGCARRTGCRCEALSMSDRVRMSKGRSNFSSSSSCHCCTRLPGATIRQRFRSPRSISSLMSRPAMIVLPAPGSSASRNRSGCRRSITSYTARIWWGSGSIVEEKHRLHRVEQVGQLDAARLGGETEELAVGTEGELGGGALDLELGFTVAVDDRVAQVVVDGADDQGARLVARHRGRHDRDGAGRVDAPNPHARFQILQWSAHARSLRRSTRPSRPLSPSSLSRRCDSGHGPSAPSDPADDQPSCSNPIRKTALMDQGLAEIVSKHADERAIPCDARWWRASLTRHGFPAVIPDQLFKRIEANDATITREMVFEHRDEDPIDLLVAAMMWGFGPIGYGPYRTSQMLTTAERATNVNDVVDEIRAAARESPEAGFSALFSKGRPPRGSARDRHGNEAPLLLSRTARGCADATRVGRCRLHGVQGCRHRRTRPTPIHALDGLQGLLRRDGRRGQECLLRARHARDGALQLVPSSSMSRGAVKATSKAQQADHAGPTPTMAVRIAPCRRARLTPASSISRRFPYQRPSRLTPVAGSDTRRPRTATTGEPDSSGSLPRATETQDIAGHRWTRCSGARARESQRPRPHQ